MSQPLIAARNAPVRTAAARPEARADAGRPELQVVAPPSRRRLRLPTPLLCVVVLTLGLFGLLMTNIAIAGDAYEITDLQTRSQRLTDSQQAADEALAAVSSPQQLAQRADELGMVPAPDPVHLSTSSAGATAGTPTAAPEPTPAPTATAP